MRRPDHRKADKIAKKRDCPECGADLQVHYDGAYIDCLNDRCDWMGWAYEAVGAFS